MSRAACSTLDDEFAKTLGEYSDIDNVRAEIHQGLEQQNLENYNRTL